MENVLKAITIKVIAFDYQTEIDYNKDKSQISFYFLKYNGQEFKDRMNEINELSKNLIIFIQNYYFCQVVSLIEEVKGVAIIKRFILSEIVQTNKNSHLNKVNFLRDLYV
jgi:hypothetical protein